MIFVTVLSVTISWIILFLPEIDPAVLEALVVETSFDHANGILLLVVLCSLFDTPWSWASRILLERRARLLQRRAESSDTAVLPSLDAH